MTVTPAAPPVQTAADFTPEQLELRERARRFVDEVLIPNEELAERSGGKIPDELKQQHQAARRSTRGCRAGSTRSSTAGRAGRRSSGSSSRSSSAARRTRSRGTCRAPTTCSASGSPEQIERYLKPALRGELHDAYAVTEAEAGSDPSRIETTARRSDGGWVIDGEKWFVTYGDVAASTS